jgi:DNA replication protein DnaC
LSRPVVLKNAASSTIWGLEPLDAAARHDLLEILEERYGRRSTVITSQLLEQRWCEAVGDPTFAAAIMDHQVHNAHRIEPTGETVAGPEAKNSSLLTKTHRR